MTKLRPSYLAAIFIIAVCLIVFRASFKGKVALPADLIIGAYQPWLSQIWPGHPTGIAVKNPILSDAISLQYPWKISVINSLKNKQLPYWNTDIGLGMPLAANWQSQALYPLNIVFFSPFSLAVNWNIFIFLQLFLGLIFTYLFCRSLYFSRPASLFSSVAFCFSTFMLANLEYGNYDHTLIWLPLMLYLSQKIHSLKYSFGSPVLLVFATYNLWTGGYPFVTFWCLAFFLCYFILFVRNWLVLVCVSVGSLFALPQILPTLELYRLSVREVDSHFQIIDRLLPFKNLITILVPNFFGNPSSYNYFGHLVYREDVWYTGIYMAPLLLYSLFIKKHSKIIFFLISGVITLLLALNSPLGRWFYSLPLPGFAGLSVSISSSIFAFSLSMVAGYSLDHLAKKLKQFILLLSILTVLIGSLFLFPLSPISISNLRLPLILLLTGLVLTFLFRKKIMIISLLLLLITTADFLYQADRYLPFTEAQLVYPTTPVLTFLQNQTGQFRSTGVLPRNSFSAYHLNFVEGLDPLLPRRYSQFANAVNGKLFSPTGRYADIFNFGSPLLDFANVKFILSQNPLELKKLTLISHTDDIYLYENTKALPRIQLFNQYFVLPSEQSTLDQLLTLDLAHQIIVDRPPPFEPSAKKLIYEVKKIDYSQMHVVIDVATNQPSLISIADLYYPGWHATVNGNQVPIYQANLFFRAVPLPSGDNRVVLQYQPL